MNSPIEDIARFIDDSKVHVGVWTNWSHGSIRGVTLTLTKDNGEYLTPFIALFITFAGTCFWRIACFAMHLKFSSQSAQDGLYHQKQALLRNAVNGTNTLTKLLFLLWVWRRHVERPYGRILPLLGLAIASTGAFSAAGVLSSKLSSEFQNEVLVQSPSCGIILGDTTGDIRTVLSSGIRYIVQSTSAALNYARECYAENATPEQCPKYITPRINYTAWTDFDCPFPGLCRDDIKTLHLDSGFINSQHHLGINSQSDERFLYRMVTQCAPLAVNATHKDEKSVSFKLGINTYYNSSDTYNYSMPDISEFTAYPDYTLSSLVAYGSYPNDSDFEPISALNPSDADVTLIFLSANSITSIDPINDPWYATHSYPFVDGNTTFYFADELVKVLACVEQEQWCNAERQEISGDGCGPLSGFYTSSRNASHLWASERQRRAFDWNLGVLANAPNFDQIVTSLQSSSLLARNSLYAGHQAPLPDDQWELEMKTWFATRLAGTQQAVVNAAEGSKDKDMVPHVSTPPDDESKRICKNQKIRAAKFTSFNVLGLAITFCVGGLIIIISYTMEPLVYSYLRWKKRDSFPLLEWINNDTFYLQHLAHEELGCGHWELGTLDIPRTGYGERLAVLDTSDPHHPRLKNSFARADTRFDGRTNYELQVRRVAETGNVDG